MPDLFRLNFLLTILALLLTSAVAQGRWVDDQTCLDPQVSESILSEFNITTNRADVHFDNCSPSNLSYKVVLAAQLLKTLPKIDPTPSTYNQKIMGSDPVHFFKSRISKIVLENYRGRYCDLDVDHNGVPIFGTLAYVIQGSTEMTLCPWSAENSPVDVAATLLHEARHVDGHKHVPCEGPLKNFEGNNCDTSYADQGSYAINVEFWLNLTNTETLDPILRSSMRSQALSFLVLRFNQMPFGIKDGALLHEPTGALSFFDGQDLTEVLPASSRTAVVASRPGSVVSFDSETNTVTSFSNVSLSISPATGPIAEKYRNTLSLDQKKNLLDVFFGEYSCFLFPQELICEQGPESVAISLQRIQPVQLFKMNRSALVNNHIIYISAKDGFLYALPKTFRELRRLKEASLKKSTRAYKLNRLSPWKNDLEMGLSDRGEVKIFSPQTKTWSQPLALANKSFVNIVSPFLWSPQMKDF